MTSNERKPGLWKGTRAKALSAGGNPSGVEMLQPTRENVMRAVWNRLRVEPRNIKLDEIVDELGLCTGEDRTVVSLDVMHMLNDLQVPADIVHGTLTYFPEAR